MFVIKLIVLSVIQRLADELEKEKNREYFEVFALSTVTRCGIIVDETNALSRFEIEAL